MALELKFRLCSHTFKISSIVVEYKVVVAFKRIDNISGGRQDKSVYPGLFIVKQKEWKRWWLVAWA